MNISDDQIIALLRDTHRCRPEVTALAEKLADLGASRYNTLASRLIEQGDDHALGILLNVAAVNEILFDPVLLANTLRALKISIDINFLYRYQDEHANPALYPQIMVDF